MNFASKLGVPDYEFRLVLGLSRIEYDPTKDERNRATHGYSLESAAYYLEKLTFPTGKHHPYVITDAFRAKNEIRHIHMTVDDNNYVVVMITTMRSKDSDEVIRIISLRRAHLNEREKFRQLTGYIQPQR